jgi:hypothetical protein
MNMAHERASCVISFDNLGDSSLDAREASTRGKVADVPLPPLLITPG